MGGAEEIVDFLLVFGLHQFAIIGCDYRIARWPSNLEY